MQITNGRVLGVRRDRDDAFVVDAGGEVVSARTVLLTTGDVNNRPRIGGAAHDRALAKSRIRYCPVRDGYEANDRIVGVTETGTHGYNEVVFLQMHPRRSHSWRHWESKNRHRTRIAPYWG